MSQLATPSKKRVGDAQRQHQCYLSEGKLGQRGGDLGPVILEQQDEHARQGQQDGCGEQGFFAGGAGLWFWLCRGMGHAPFSTGFEDSIAYPCGLFVNMRQIFSWQNTAI